MRHLYILLLILVLLVWGGWAGWARWAENRDWKTVEKILGFPGETQGAGFQVRVPRRDLNVLVRGAWLDPQGGLSSWFAFEPSEKDCLLIGELTVVDDELAKVEKQLMTQELTLCALYRPYTGETPGVECIRFEGRGRRVNLAQKAKALLAATGMPLTPVATNVPSKPEPWVEPVKKLLGPGQLQGTALKFTFYGTGAVNSTPQPLSSYMEMDSRLYFQPDGKQAQVYGQWVVPSAQAGRVIAALLQVPIPITSTSSFLEERAAGVVLISFWTQGDAVQLAKGLKEVLKASGLIEAPPSEEKQTASQTQKR